MSVKALVQTGFGAPEDVLSISDVEVPVPGDDEVLIGVRAASVNALDWHMVRGMPYPIRMGASHGKSRPMIRGIDLAGRVEAIGKDVTGVQPGDEVFGGGDGSFAEYTTTRADRVTAIPSGFTVEQAATLNIAGITSLQGLRDGAHVKPGHRVLIHGAGGGVGTFAVQIARCLGAHVTAVTRTEYVHTIEALGADAVIDYCREDFTRRPERYDVIFDVGGTRSFSEMRRAMTKKGTLVVVGGPAGRWLAPLSRLAAAAVISPLVSQRLLPLMSRNDPSSLGLLRQIAESGNLHPVIARQYPLDEAAAAIRFVGEGQACGKVVVSIK